MKGIVIKIEDSSLDRHVLPGRIVGLETLMSLQTNSDVRDAMRKELDFLRAVMGLYTKYPDSIPIVYPEDTDKPPIPDFLSR